jgi:LPS O-antigen subunit length determinant protein (WzzB/FepE family)
MIVYHIDSHNPKDTVTDLADPEDPEDSLDTIEAFGQKWSTGIWIAIALGAVIVLGLLFFFLKEQSSDAPSITYEPIPAIDPQQVQEVEQWPTQEEWARANHLRHNHPTAMTDRDKEVFKWMLQNRQKWNTRHR